MKLHRAFQAVPALAVFAGAVACNGIFGIEERAFDPSAAPLSCQTYCEKAATACAGAYVLYTSTAVCLATCAKFELGTATDTGTNTIGCRFGELLKADETGERDTHCPAAGPGGGNGACGGDCESYCLLFQAACKETTPLFENVTECLDACAKVPHGSMYTALIAPEESIECRLYHVTSAVVAPTEHCSHAAGQFKCCVHPDAGDLSCVTK